MVDDHEAPFTTLNVESRIRYFHCVVTIGRKVLKDTN